MLAWSERKGRVVPKPETEMVLKTLSQRGYLLGLISNTMSTLDIPGFVERHGWDRYLGVVLLSAFEKSRKPAPELFLRAASQLGVLPTECAYIGNRFSKDIVGCKRAGYSLGIILRDPAKPVTAEGSSEAAPDLRIDSLEELLNLFPPRK
jgi:putative hydrolase of the HAD superfamily